MFFHGFSRVEPSGCTFFGDLAKTVCLRSPVVFELFWGAIVIWKISLFEGQKATRKSIRKLVADVLHLVGSLEASGVDFRTVCHGSPVGL